MVRPLTVIGLPLPEPKILPGVELTVYSNIAESPFELGAVKLTETEPLPPVAVPIVGAPGTVAAVATVGSATGSAVEGTLEPHAVTRIIDVLTRSA